MKAKEEAKELVYKYENLVTTWDCYWDTEIPVENRLPEMKQCALIAVDKILDAIKINLDANSTSTWIVNFSSNKILYWEEVRKEIEKL
jgi:hypothetical protein